VAVLAMRSRRGRPFITGCLVRTTRYGRVGGRSGACISLIGKPVVAQLSLIGKPVVAQRRRQLRMSAALAAATCYGRWRLDL
jgi:hypothetical protein